MLLRNVCKFCGVLATSDRNALDQEQTTRSRETRRRIAAKAAFRLSAPARGPRPTDVDQRYAARFDQELLRQFTQNRVSASPVILLLIVTIGLLSRLWTSALICGAWTACILLIHLVIICTCRQFLSQTPSTVKLPAWRMRFIVLDLLFGVAWTFIMVFPIGSDEQAGTFMLFVMLLVVAISSMLASSLSVAVFALTLPVTIALALDFVLNPARRRDLAQDWPGTIERAVHKRQRHRPGNFRGGNSDRAGNVRPGFQFHQISRARRGPLACQSPNTLSPCMAAHSLSTLGSGSAPKSSSPFRPNASRRHSRPYPAARRLCSREPTRLRRPTTRQAAAERRFPAHVNKFCRALTAFAPPAYGGRDSGSGPYEYN